MRESEPYSLCDECAVRICFKAFSSVPELHGSVWVKVEKASPFSRFRLIYLAWWKISWWLQPWGICEELLCCCRSSCRCLFSGWSLVFSSRWSSAIRNLSQYHMIVRVEPHPMGSFLHIRQEECVRVEAFCYECLLSTWSYPDSD